MDTLRSKKRTFLKPLAHRACGVLALCYGLTALCTAPAQAATTRISYFASAQYDAPHALRERQREMQMLVPVSGPDASITHFQIAPQHQVTPELLQARLQRRNAFLDKMTLNISLNQQLPLAGRYLRHSKWRYLRSLAGWYDRTRTALRMGLENGAENEAPGSPTTRWLPAVAISHSNFRANVRWYLGPTH